jgi:hypothetical protein
VLRSGRSTCITNRGGCGASVGTKNRGGASVGTRNGQGRSASAAYRSGRWKILRPHNPRAWVISNWCIGQVLGGSGTVLVFGALYADNTDGRGRPSEAPHAVRGRMVRCIGCQKVEADVR